MASKPFLEYHRQVVPTLEGIATQAPEERWINDTPVYEMRVHGVNHLFGYDVMNRLYTEWLTKQLETFRGD